MDSYSLGSHTVGRVGFGAMQLPGPGVFGPPRDHDQAIAVLKRVIELGIDHIDTAQFYGPNVANELIREALHPYPADLTLVSKVGGKREFERDEQPPGKTDPRLPPPPDLVLAPQRHRHPHHGDGRADRDQRHEHRLKQQFDDLRVVEESLFHRRAPGGPRRPSPALPDLRPEAKP